ncbi:MAG: LEA type 2 family protein [Trueperaceae bacterium]|nr:LEA type 2 family protein [Trueperaceae bacterium]
MTQPIDVVRRTRPSRAPLRVARVVGAVAVLVVLVVAACSPTSRPSSGAEITSATPIGDVFGPRFELLAEETFIERFDPPGAGAALVVAIATTVRNPNDFPVTIDHVDYRLSLAGVSVAAGVLEPGLELTPGDAQQLTWRVDADLAERRELWRAVVDAYAGTPLPFTIDGAVRFTSEAYAFTTRSRTLVDGSLLATQAVVAPRLRLDGRESRLTIVRADAPVVSLALFAVNVGDVGYFLSGRELELELNGHVLATIDLGPVPVPAGETSRADLLFIIDRGRLSRAAGEALDEALAGRRGDVRLRGAFVYDVLGVDSYLAPIGEGLLVTLPASRLPSAAPEATPGAAEPGEDDQDDAAP